MHSGTEDNYEEKLGVIFFNSEIFCFIIPILLSMRKWWRPFCSTHLKHLPLGEDKNICSKMWIFKVLSKVMKRTAAPFLQELQKNLAACLLKFNNIAVYREGCCQAETVCLILQPEVVSYWESCLCAAPWSPWCLPEWHSCLLAWCRSAFLNSFNSTKAVISTNTLTILDVCFTHLPGSKDVPTEHRWKWWKLINI